MNQIANVAAYMAVVGWHSLRPIDRKHLAWQWRFRHDPLGTLFGVLRK